MESFVLELVCYRHAVSPVPCRHFSQNMTSIVLEHVYTPWQTSATAWKLFLAAFLVIVFRYSLETISGCLPGHPFPLSRQLT